MLKDEETLQKKWINLKRRLNKKSERRNHFVHFQMYMDFSNPKKNERLILKPQYFDTRFNLSSKETKDYVASEIDQIRESFEALAEELKGFAAEAAAISQKLLQTYARQGTSC